MSSSPSERLFRSTARYAASLTAILVLAALAFGGVVQLESAKESYSRDAIERYHLQTVPLLDRVVNRLAELELHTLKQDPSLEDVFEAPLESPRTVLLDARAAIRTVLEIQQSVGTDDLAPTASRLADRFARLERSTLAVLDRRMPIGSASLPLPSARLAAEQLRMLHEVSLAQSLAASRGRRATAFRNTALIGVGLAAICTLLLARIFVLLRRELRHAQRIEAELDRTRDRLLHSQKIEALGRLTGGVAHDFNNLLTSILGHAELLRERLPPGDPLHEDAKQILEGGERASALTRQLLAFSRRQISKPEAVDVNELIEELLKMLDDVLGEKFSLLAALADEAGVVRADRRQLEQVIVNLTLNARDAMPCGGRIRLETANVAESQPLGPERKEAGGSCSIRVIDEGAGIPPEIMPSIFDPFFTTKPEGEGTGLGLSTVKGLVTSWGGDVRVRSELGRGSCFEILLPRHDGEPKLETRRTAPPLRKGSETILVVEDQDAVRTLAGKFLAQAGYTVLEADSGEKALRLHAEVGGRIDLLLIDVVMPDLSGPEVVAHVRRSSPELRVLYMSGYTDDEHLRRRVWADTEALVEKPFRRAEMLKAVRSTLDAESVTAAR